MTQDWQELTKLTRGESFTIEKVKMVAQRHHDINDVVLQ
jgi:hypothetical protein